MQNNILLRFFNSSLQSHLIQLLPAGDFTVCKIVCDAGEVVKDGACVPCAAGSYEKEGVCELCAAGTFNGAEVRWAKGLYTVYVSEL